MYCCNLMTWNTAAVASPPLNCWIRLYTAEDISHASITVDATHRQDLKKTGRPVWVCLDLVGAGKELSFKCKAYEDVHEQHLDGSRNSEVH